MGSPAMNRRAFLRLTMKGKERALELACERLYMRWIDALAGAGVERASEGVDPPATEWEGEPPLDVAVPTTGQLLAELESGLHDVHVLRLTGREWLAGDDFRREVEARIEAFRSRGGRVE